MTSDEILARAAERIGPALHALVAGHLQAGRVEMAEAALHLSPESLARLDAWFAPSMEAARDAGAAAALAAMTGSGGQVVRSDKAVGWDAPLDMQPVDHVDGQRALPVEDL